VSINRTILTGRLGKNPDLRYTQSGKAVATFSLAVTDNYNREVTHWLNIVTWNKSAENVAQYLSKGSHVAVEGRISTRNYENKEGRKVYVTEIVADRVEFLDSKGKGDKPAGNWDEIGHEIDTDDEEPF
jgi:single-strand DNA-binding protein